MRLMWGNFTCAPCMGACSIRTCQFPSHLPLSLEGRILVTSWRKGIPLIGALPLFANPLSMANHKKVWLLDSRGHMLPVEEVKSEGKRSGILGSETSFSCFAVHRVANQPVNRQHRLVQSTISTMKVRKVGSKKASGWGMRN